jgi:hypothetical protein
MTDRFEVLVQNARLRQPTTEPWILVYEGTGLRPLQRAWMTAAGTIIDAKVPGN